MNTDGIIIEKMKAETAAMAAQLEKICFSSPWSEEALLEELENPDAYFVAAVNGEGQLLGYGGMHTPCGECYVDNIAVSPEWRRQGIGERILENLEEKAAQLGTFISLEVRPSNVGAVSLYEKRGFQRIGERKNFYSDPTENGLIMTKYFGKEEDKC